VVLGRQKFLKKGLSRGTVREARPGGRGVSKKRKRGEKDHPLTREQFTGNKSLKKKERKRTIKKEKNRNTTNGEKSIKKNKKKTSPKKETHHPCPMKKPP